jgi:uncharacterized protein (TIGR02217 family)
MHITTRLSKQVELGANRRDTEDLLVQTSDGGHEVRELRASQSLLEFEVSYPISTRVHPRLLEIRDCFKATRGGAHSFDFRDWLDYQATDEVFATGDGATLIFQLVKSYAFGGVTHTRRIQRPVSPITLKKNGVVTASGFTVDYDLGLVTFGVAPLGGVTPDEWSWSGEFDVPVRFDGALETRAPNIRLEKVGTVPLLEVRLKASDFA